MLKMQPETIDKIVLHGEAIFFSGLSAGVYAGYGIPPSDQFLAVRQLLDIGDYEDARLIAEYPDLFQERGKSPTEYKS